VSEAQGPQKLGWETPQIWPVAQLPSVRQLPGVQAPLRQRLSAP
jgi:hypothetical protein